VNPRLVDTSDLPALAAVHARAFQPSWNDSEIADLLGGAGAFGLIVEAPEPVAMVLCRAIAGEGEILTLAVDPAARRLGLGRALVAAAFEAARSRHAEAMFLEVAADNSGALALYENSGFRKVGVRRGYYGRADYRADAIVMRCDLNTGAV
jgi:[ribosomal protein S18]-alanine N-acetyltransferase